MLHVNGAEILGHWGGAIVYHLPDDLAIRNMTASAAGTVENPGRNVAAKSGLNRSILEQGWGIIRNQLVYKAEWAGKQLVEVDPRRTSRICSGCGAVDPDSRQGKSYACRQCGLSIDADVNAARNILKRAVSSPVGTSPKIRRSFDCRSSLNTRTAVARCLHVSGNCPNERQRLAHDTRNDWLDTANHLWRSVARYCTGQL